MERKRRTQKRFIFPVELVKAFVETIYPDDARHTLASFEYFAAEELETLVREMDRLSRKHYVPYAASAMRYGDFIEAVLEYRREKAKSSSKAK